MIPTGDKRGVLFSVDDPCFFHVSNRQCRYQSKRLIETRQNAVETLAVFPDTEEFKHWMLVKLPYDTAHEYKDGAPSMFNSYLTLDRDRSSGAFTRFEHPVSFIDTRIQAI